MTQLNVKGSPRKIDPKDPKSHPGYQKAVDAAKRRGSKMQFESEGQKRDYDRQVAANPNNIPGLPPFFPPEKLRSAGIPFRDLTGEEIEQKEAWDKRALTTQDVRLWCKRCRKETEHSVSMDSSFCKKCGGKAPYHF